MKANRRNFLKKTVSATALTIGAPLVSFGQEFLFEPSDLDAGHIFLTKPYLQNPSIDSMTIMWIVNLASYSYIEFGETKTFGQRARKTENGLVVAYNRVNKISLNNLKSGTTYYYRAVSKEITKFDPYKLVYGETIKSEIYSFTTPSKEQDSVSLLILNDIHDRPASIPHLAKLVNKQELDYVFFNGDVFNHQEDEQQIIDHMLTPSCDEFASEIPFYFVRGNHETRGKFCRNLHHYFSNPNEQQYYEFRWGSTHFTVIDTGEDKPDDTEVYADIVDFDSYRMEQLQWFKKVADSNIFKNAAFRVVLMHIPIYYSGDWHGTMHLRELFSDVFNQTKIDICISGHTHRYGVHEPKDGQHNYPIIIGGGPKEGQRTAILLNTTSDTLNLNMIDDQGKQVGNYNLTSKT